MKSRGPTSPTNREMGGAAAAGGILGYALAGPVVAVAAGIGGAIIATSNGKAGGIARASGETVSSGGDRIKEWNKKHQVSAKASRAMRTTGSNIKKWDEKHRVTEKTSNAVVQGCNKLSKLLKPSEPSRVISKNAMRNIA
eukprot:CAMPEP_0194131484 /NCGR_PEP_ID=MMETSP0152-20130528/2251_1 /TAXON_ID=1049557 /ORGANISM="Thalassiothrix antarctica, Strain L6-D1" /LENGTH=139 /DNA_ID=CAMNT_0038826281 /DNA_START=19 /DNA_END=438 /DNA_ORIENTATION=-